MRTLARRLSRSLAPALVLLTAAPLLGQAKQIIPRPAGQQVNFPYLLRDNNGMNWDVQMDGSIGDGGNDQYDGGGRLMIGGQQYQPGQGLGNFDPKTNEVTLGNQTMGGLVVHRRVAVNAANSYCRWTEVLENSGNAPVKVNVHIQWDMGGAIVQHNELADPRKKTPLGTVIFDGQRGVAMLGNGSGAKVTARYQPQQNTDQCGLFYDVEVPAKQAAVIVHFQVWRQTAADAQGVATGFKEKDILGDLSKELKRYLVNFRRTENSLSDIELPRQGLLDVVELRSGDQYRGTLKDASFKLETFHGPVELPAERVIGMLSVGVHRPTQLFVTADGEVIGGLLSSDTIAVQLSSGQTVKLPVSAISRIGCRKRATETEELKIDKPMAMLRDGQRIGVELPIEPISVASLYGQVLIKPEWLHSISFFGEEQQLHQIRLKDGSKFASLITADSLALRLRGTGRTDATASIAPGPEVKFPLASIARLQFVPADTEAEDTEPPTMTLTNGDTLIGTISGVLELQTNFDTLKLNGNEIRGVARVAAPATGIASPSEVTLTLWDGATLSGRLKGDAIDVALRSGPAMRVPVSLVDQYNQPRPVPSAEMVGKIKEIVGELASTDWKVRDRAAEKLRMVGIPAVGVLKDLRGGQPAEAQKLIDSIITAIEQSNKKQSTTPAPMNNWNKDEMPIRRFR